MARIAVRTFAAAGVFAAILGFSRFSFGLLLPAIKLELQASYAAYGVISAANFAGYVAGTAAVPVLLRFWNKPRIWNATALFAMSLAMFATALAGTLAQLGSIRFLVGFASGIAAILTIALALDGVSARVRGLVSGGSWAGGGIGLAICGALIGPNAHLVWRAQYALLAAISLACSVGFALISRTRAQGAPAPHGSQSPQWSPFAYRLAIAYALFGFGYIIYMVYASAYLLRLGTQAGSVATVWIVFGMGGAFGALFWGRIFDRFGSPIVLASALVACAGGVLYNAPFITGMAVFGTPAIVSALARRVTGESSYATLLSILTACFGIGQIAGPLGAGFIIDRAGLASGIPLTAAPLAIAATLVWRRNAR